MSLQKRCNRTTTLAFVLGSSMLFASSIQAALIVPGAPAQSTPGTASFAGLTEIADVSVTGTGFDQSNTARYTATLESRVYKTASGSLDFAYQVTNLVEPSENDALHSVSVSSFHGFTTDADYITGTGVVTYDTVVRQGAPADFPISFDYTPSASAIAPGDNTDWILIKTNATVYNTGFTSLIDGTTLILPSFGPAVPEPVSLCVFTSLGSLFMLGRGRRSKRV